MWAQATAKAGSLELEAILASLRSHEFGTVLGPIGFDQKGDVTLQSPVLYAWHADGSRMLEQGGANE